MRPVNSSDSSTSRSVALTVFTGNGGGCGGASFRHAGMAASRSAATTASWFRVVSALRFMVRSDNGSLERLINVYKLGKCKSLRVARDTPWGLRGARAHDPI